MTFGSMIIVPLRKHTSAKTDALHTDTPMMSDGDAPLHAPDTDSQSSE